MKTIHEITRTGTKIIRVVWCEFVDRFRSSQDETFPKLFCVLILALTLLASPTNSTSQTNDPTRSIRQQYTSINKQLRKYRKVKKQLSGFSLEGGELTAYFAGPQIVKIIANHFGEGGRTLEEYYFKDGKLIFVFERITHYDAPLSGRVVSASENRYYFSNDQLVRWVDENTRTATDVGVIESKRVEYLANSKLFIEGARSHARRVEAPAVSH